MAGITSAVVGIGGSLLGARSQRRAQQRAARDQERATVESARILESAGRAGQGDIARQGSLAAQTAFQAAIDSAAPIEQFADVDAVRAAQNQIISNSYPSFGSSISGAADEFIRSRPEFQGLGLDAEIDRQANLAASAATPVFTGALTTAGQQGLAGVTDLSQLSQRGANRLAQIEGSVASNRANVLSGQTAGLANLAISGQDARALSQAAGQQARATGLEALAQFGGEVLEPFEGIFAKKPSGVVNNIPTGIPGITASNVSTAPRNPRIR